MDNEARELVIKLREMADKDMTIATAIRTDQPEQSYFFWKMADLMTTAAKDLERRIPQEMEIEGGGSSWWHVCPECHGAVDQGDHFCRHCGQAVK